QHVAGCIGSNNLRLVQEARECHWYMVRSHEIFTIPSQRTVTYHQSLYRRFFLRGITNSLDEIQRAFDFREFSYKQENSAIFAQAPVSAQFRSHRPESPALGTHVLRIDDMRHQKNTVQTCSVICEVLARPFASCEAGIKARDEA